MVIFTFVLPVFLSFVSFFTFLFRNQFYRQNSFEWNDKNFLDIADDLIMFLCNARREVVHTMSESSCSKSVGDCGGVES